jgi:sulfonate transport system permease protein
MMAITTRERRNALANRRIVNRPHLSRAERTTLGTCGVVGFLVLWQVAASTGLVNVLFTSSPIAVAQSAVEMIADGTLPAAIASSAAVYCLGFAISLIAASSSG